MGMLTHADKSGEGSRRHRPRLGRSSREPFNLVPNVFLTECGLGFGQRCIQPYPDHSSGGKQRIVPVLRGQAHIPRNGASCSAGLCVRERVRRVFLFSLQSDSALRRVLTGLVRWPVCRLLP
jgi:hypothetical protein